MSASAKPPVVLVHGMWSRFSTWGETPERLDAAGWRVERYELLEHGERATGDDALVRLGLTEYVDDLVGFIERLQEPPILIGHSMGGLISLLAAARTPCRGVFMITPAGPAGAVPFSPSNTIFFGRALAMQLLGPRVYKPTRWETSFGVTNALPKEKHEAHFASQQMESPWPLLQIGFWFLDRKGAARVDFDRVTCPVRIYLGAKDRLIPVWAVRGIAKKLKDSKLTIAPEAAHMVFDEPAVREPFYAWLLAELDGMAPAEAAPEPVNWDVTPRRETTQNRELGSVSDTSRA